ncbi:clr5 domain protein [Colletotrichum truncatum]|uniref:Clr5 domain protein n=1 Tax=Colletotrichum truncatum TaxID=5467 RepID=A0ACC3YTV9_COLTU|nr:clr5 domain protein [Colletotrichum truncatum]KAF6798576.1 clr5 domain protein [Colletotrichum truncatum]
MVYDWDAHEKLCFQLYINEKKSLEDIMDYLKIHHNFSPCKRAFQTQFRKWDFPSKQNPAYKNDRLVARIKELWERNLPQKEMLRVLKEDGFDIKKRELIRVRTKNRWLLKAANGERAKETLGSGLRPALASDSMFEGQSDNQRLPGDTGDMTPDTLTDHDTLGTLPDELTTAWNEDNSRRKRRRLKAWGSASQDAPVAPRFPSETTLDEAKTIIGLTNDVYRQVRSTFAQLCEESDIVKKSVAGPDRWEAVKDRLIREMSQLQDVMWQSTENQESKKLALDVICTDVTKRTRTLDKRITLAEAKNILGINPEEARDLRAVFDQILRDGCFGSKSEAGPAQWNDLKKRWEDESDLIQRIIALGPTDPCYADKLRALDILARDVMKRLRDDTTRKDKPKKESPGKAEQPKAVGAQQERNPGLSQSRQQDVVDHVRADSDLVNQYGNSGQVSSMGLVPSSGDSQPQMLMPVSLQAQTADPLGHSAARILSNALLGQSSMALESHLGSSLLLAANAQAAFVDQQYAQQFTAAQPIFHAPVPTSVAVYLRLHPSSTFVVNANLWIATLNSHSVQVLRHVAASKFPGAVCLRVEGVLKDGKGGEMPLQIDQDPELAAYLAHLQGATPTFNVQLVPGWKSG